MDKSIPSNKYFSYAARDLIEWSFVFSCYLRICNMGKNTTRKSYNRKKWSLVNSFYSLKGNYTLYFILPDSIYFLISSSKISWHNSIFWDYLTLIFVFYHQCNAFIAMKIFWHVYIPWFPNAFHCISREF